MAHGVAENAVTYQHCEVDSPTVSHLDSSFFFLIKTNQSSCNYLRKTTRNYQVNPELFSQLTVSAPKYSTTNVKIIIIWKRHKSFILVTVNCLQLTTNLNAYFTVIQYSTVLYFVWSPLTMQLRVRKM